MTAHNEMALGQLRLWPRRRAMLEFIRTQMAPLIRRTPTDLIRVREEST